MRDKASVTIYRLYLLYHPIDLVFVAVGETSEE